MPRRNRKSAPKKSAGRNSSTPERTPERAEKVVKRSTYQKGAWENNEQQRKQDEERRQRIEEERKREQERQREAQRLAEERRRKEEERLQEERRRAAERQKREREAAEEFRRQEQKKVADINAQKQKNEALLAARRKIEDARFARAQEQERQKGQLQKELAEKEEREKVIRKQNEQRMMEEMSKREASLRADEARLTEMRETDLLRKEMETRSSSRVSAPAASPQCRKRGRVVNTSEFDAFVMRIYAGIPQDPTMPAVPFVKVPNKSGVFRFGTRNITLLAAEDGRTVLVRQGINHVPFVDFVNKYKRTESMKLKGMACLNGFMGAGYV